MEARHAVEIEHEPDYEALHAGASLSANLAAGAFAGIMEHTIMYPVDAIKTRLQVLNPSPAALYDGMANAAAQMSAKEGFRSLWRGVSSVILGAGPAHAVYFATYEGAKSAFGADSATEHHPFAIAAAGGCATMASDALMNPFDVIKQRMQVHGSPYNSVLDCARQVYRAEGTSAFYVSYPATILMTIPFAAIQFAAYDSFSKIFNPKNEHDPLLHSMIGGIAGGLGAAATTPLDVVKTLLQTRGTSSDPRIRKCNGLWGAARVVYQLNGYRGFARGMTPRIVNMAPSTGICWASYEMAKRYFAPPKGEASV
ncbi:mitochondrial carrier [Aulographum hederae CBS 113979]|uniref:Mitochondrial carrier n=1 Tax=Aulographum hederae CBS 113979 TaxID=1176131 RepID=A0A6G1HAN5_9PEZI|nr:mitochondrial carrier [Aulographum hederae CBS 113979]